MNDVAEYTRPPAPFHRVGSAVYCRCCEAIVADPNDGSVCGLGLWRYTHYFPDGDCMVVLRCAGCTAEYARAKQPDPLPRFAWLARITI